MLPNLVSIQNQNTKSGKVGEKMPSLQEPQQRPQRPSSMLALPDEVWVNILEFASLDLFPFQISRQGKAVYLPGTMKCIILTCQRFYRLVIPFYYRSIKFSPPRSVVPSEKLVRVLHQTLQKYPKLGRYCRELKFHISDIRRDPREFTADDFKFIREITLSLPNTQVLDIYGGFADETGKHTWDVVRGCVQNMKSLQRASLSREGHGGITVPRIVEVLESPSLRTLCVGGVAEALVSDSFWASRVCAVLCLSSSAVFAF